MADQLGHFKSAHKAARDVEDASLTFLNLVLYHLQKVKFYVRILFIDFPVRLTQLWFVCATSKINQYACQLIPCIMDQGFPPRSCAAF